VQTVEGNVTRFERLGLEDGLSEAQILAILQDSQGFLWIGTQDGLNKCDGYTFTAYRPDLTNPASLSTKVIHEIQEDARGDLWLGTDRGLERFDKRSEVFTPYQFDQRDEPASGQNLVRTILADADGALWIGTMGQGLYRLERRTGRWTVYQHDPQDPHSLASNNVTALLEDAHGTLWVGTHGGGLGRLDRQTGEFTVCRHREEDPQSLSSNNVTALCEDGQGILWIGTETAGLNALNTAARTPRFARHQHEQDNPHSLSHNYVMALLVDTTGTLWVGTGRGLNELDGARNGFRRHYHEEGDPLSLSHSEILSLAEDAQGILWIGTRLGLSKFDRTTRAFGHFKRDPHTQGALSSNAVSAFLEDTEGYLWIGTYGGGLNRSVGSDTLTGFLHFAHREEDPHSLSDRRALPSADRPVLMGDNAVLALCQDARERLWIGTRAGLHKLEPGDDLDSAPTFVRYQHERDDAGSLSHDLVLALADDGKGHLWVGTYGGLNRLDLADPSQGFVRYLHDEDDPHSISHDFIRTIYVDSADNMWIGTNGGLNRLTHAEDSRFVRYQHDSQDPHSLSHDRVYCITEDAHGVLWLGTDRGLNRFDPQTEQFTAYREQHGLGNDVVYGVLVDNEGCLWLATNRGIDRFDPSTEEFTHYDVYDGVQDNEFTQGAFYKDRLGRLYFGGFNGFNVFCPDNIRENTYEPPVVLTSFLLANKPMPVSEAGPLREHINFAQQIELAPEDYVFAFEFSALNYRQPHKNRFAYMLEGFDRDWIYTGARDRKAVYTNVPPGSYTFRVRAANDDGLWNEEGTSIQVTVSQPWWHILFRSAFEAVIIHDGKSILQLNQAALELLGYEPAELIGQSIYSLVSPGGRAEVAQRVSTGDETPYEATGLRKDGSAFVAEIRGRAIPYQGRTVRVAAIRDITERKRAEEALRQSQEFLQAALDSLSAHIAVLDHEGTIVTVNASWRRFAEQNGLGWEDYGVGRNYLATTEAAVGQEAHSAHQVAKGIREVMAGQRSQFSVQYPCHSPGEERWFEMRVTRFESPQGVQVAIAHEDITERVGAAQALQQSEAKFRGFVEQSTDGIFLVDEEGAVIEWNLSLEEITGISREEVLGTPAWDVQDQLVTDEQRTPGVRERFKAAMLDALQAGQASWLDETVQAVYRRTDGAIRHVEQRLFPIKTEQGYRIGGISVDITERRAAEAQLRTLSRAVEQSDSTIVVTDLEGTIEFVNPAFSRVTGYTAQEAFGQNPRILKSGEMPREVYRDLWRTITRGLVWEGELLNKKKDAELYWEWAIISPVRDGAGNPTHYVAVKQDITARKQAEQALERRVRHERALAECSQILLRGDGAKALNRQILNEALAPLMEAVEASRAYVFRNFQDPEDGFCSGIVAEAVVPGLPRNLENPFSHKIPWASAPAENRVALQAGQPCGGRTEVLFASTPELLDALREMGILSVQFFPIHFGDEWWGYVGFDDCQTAREWDPEEILVLGTASQMIGSGLQRWQAEAALKEAHDELEERVRARTAELNEAVLSLRREIDQREAAEAETRAQLVIQQGLATMSARLMQAADFEQAIADVLAQTGALLGAARVFLVRLRTDGQAVHRIYEWCASAFSPFCDHAENWTVDGISWWLEELRRRGWFHFEDISGLPEQLQASTPFSGGNPAGSYCAIPVHARHEMIGLLGCEGLAPTGEDLDKHRRVLEVIVGILSSAWLREQVLETLDQRIAARTRELSTFFDLTTLAIGTEDLSEMLDPIPARILELGSCDAMCVHLIDVEGTTLTLATHGNLPPGARQRLQAIALERDFLQRMEQRGDSMVVTGEVDTRPLPRQLRLEGFVSYLGVPIPGGWVSYYRSSADGFSLDESSLLLALAEQIGVSIENHRLRQRIEAAVTLEERGRLARDLHDSVTQSLYSLSLFARSGRDALEEGDTQRLTSSLGRLESTALQSLREMRLLLYELRPEALEQEGLIRTLERRFDTVERRAGMTATALYEAPDGLELPQAVERELYYLIMEALNNTLKHGLASEVTVVIWVDPAQVRVEVADNGIGFDPQLVTGGYGLEDMRERVERLGGELEISSRPGAGTRIQVRAGFPGV